jgi:pimeloyl-ACP methyl ester carboxylesterase
LTAERSRRLIAGVRVEVYPELGHGLLFQAPDRVLPHLQRFLHEQDVPRSTA